MGLTERQAQIVAVSLSIIAKRGIQSLTIKNIAAELSITEAAIYRHFKSKHDILLAIMDMFEQISTNVPKLYDPSLTALEKMELFLNHRYITFASDHDLARVMFAEVLFQSDDELSLRMMQIMKKHKKQLDSIIDSGQKNGELRTDLDAKTMFRIIIGSMRLLVNQWCLSGFEFDLLKEGRELWENVKEIIVA